MSASGAHAGSVSPNGRTIVKSFSVRWSSTSGWSPDADAQNSADTQLLLAFGPANAPERPWFDELASRWPNARVVYSTTGGQIDGSEVHDATVVLTGITFEKTRMSIVARGGAGIVPCEELGAELGRELSEVQGVRHVLVFVDGLYVNGAAFTRGMANALPEGVTVSGGLASDGTSFEITGVGLDGPPEKNRVVAIALCGDALRVGTGSAGGWIPFGPERTVTRAAGTTVFELDGEPALSVYKRYLGDLANELPGSALLFPLSLAGDAKSESVVRTILGIDEDAGSLRFAGDVPAGSKVKLMRSTIDQLLDGASLAAQRAMDGLGNTAPELMLCISCIGRRAVFKSRVEEELEEVSNIAGSAVVCGYYSNGEISPPINESIALLHNQTMTITAFGEA